MISNKKQALVEDHDFSYENQDPAVADYLRSSPEFFVRNPELLLEIEVPHYERGAVSLVERRLSLHREQYNDLRDRLAEIVEVAHQNDHLADLLHNYSVGLMSADSIVDVFNLTHATLINELGCEDVRAIVLRNEVIDVCVDSAPDFLTLQDPAFTASQRDLHSRRPVYCGHASAERIRQFFPHTTLAVKSVAIIRLSQTVSRSSVDIGYVALASESKSRFAPHMGTDFLQRFGALLSARLAVFYD